MSSPGAESNQEHVLGWDGEKSLAHPFPFAGRGANIVLAPGRWGGALDAASQSSPFRSRVPRY